MRALAHAQNSTRPIRALLFKDKDGVELRTAICCNVLRASSTSLLLPIKIFVTSKPDRATNCDSRTLYKRH